MTYKSIELTMDRSRQLQRCLLQLLLSRVKFLVFDGVFYSNTCNEPTSSRFNLGTIHNAIKRHALAMVQTIDRQARELVTTFG